MSNAIIACACGCGESLTPKDKWGRTRKFISGHNTPRKYKNPTQYKREWNHRNRTERYEYKKLYLKELKEKIILLKGGKCTDCSYAYTGTNHTVFDLHHLDPKGKDHTVSKIIGNRAWALVLKEVDKCVMLCANCHRLRHDHLEQAQKITTKTE